MSEYVLGTDDAELSRLAFQHEVWGGVTAGLLERARVGPGARVLDLGCGPGFTTAMLRERVGEGGSVVALDASPRWHAHLRGVLADRGWTNVEPLEARIEEAELGEGVFDFVLARWVFSFLPDPPAVMGGLARALVPGGGLLIQDYNHEGVSLFPRSAGFEAMIRATRELYERSGGDTWIAGRLPGLAMDAGLRVADLRSTVLSGGPESLAFRWADTFFPSFAGTFVEQGLATEEEREGFLEDWEARKGDPRAVFFSPIVVDLELRR